MSIRPADPIPSIITSLLKTLQSQGCEILDYRLQTNAITMGYNFCSGIAKLKVDLKQLDNTIEEKSFVFKIPSQCPFYDQLSALNMYRNEVLMYSHIIPAISQLAQCNWIATCYLLPDSDNLVFEDLNVYGYKLMDKKSQFDLAHSEMALKALAQLHALSVRLYEKSKETVEMIRIPAREPARNDGRPPSALLRRFENTVAMLDLPKRILRKVHRFVAKNATKTLDDTMVPNEEYLNVLCHGDFWLGNMLFKHNNRQDVEQIKLLDFQMTHWCSPVVDLIKFFVTSVRFDVYRSSRDSLIGIYLETFNRCFESLGSEVRYSRDDLDRDMRTYRQYHLYCLGYYLSSVLNEEDPFNHYSESCDDEFYTSPLYQGALLKWLRHLSDERLL